MLDSIGCTANVVYIDNE